MRLMNFLLEKLRSTKNIGLSPLTPDYNKDHHSSYIERINTALKNPKIHNIALSGNYGMGKSSILQEVVRQNKKRVVEISLSALAPAHHSGDIDTTAKQETTTNKIQQEIVKQLLYRIEPHKAPDSRFRRIERFNLWQELGFALPTSMIIMIGFTLMGWSDKLYEVVLPAMDITLWIHPFIFLLGILCTFSIRRLLHGRIHISKLSAGSATVSLDGKAASYFDQYLDEIVYFFEVSKKTTVVLEDIDRFEDAHIFETLRALNTLLNAAPQIKKPIRFIYAIKDSIFDPNALDSTYKKTTTPEEAEVQRANRTKFFDLVIPVVPFITHRSARDLVLQILENIEHNIDDELINLAARYVPDMRLLKNVHNEFIVFREKLLTEENTLNLNDSELFAMMLYKSTHMTDFELIRLGKSKLDELYQISRQLVASNISKLEKSIRNDLNNQAKISADNLARRSEEFGNLLIEHIESTLRATNSQIEKNTLTFDNKTIAFDHLKDFGFWEAFISSKNPLLSLRASNGHYLPFEFRYSDLPKAFASINDWMEIEKKDFEASIHKQKTQLKTLRSAFMGDLIKQPNFLVQHNNSEQSFDAIARDILSNGLAYQLLLSGYINDNFTLYTSIFYKDTVSPAATNFILHNVKRNIMDEHLELEETDIEAIAKESGVSALKEPCLYNISILNYLLKNDIEKAGMMIQSLTQLSDEALRFLQAYMNGENDHLALIKTFTQETGKTLEFLINTIELDDETRLNLVNTALENLNPELDYDLDDSVTEYLSAHYAELPILLSSTEAGQAENIAKLYSNAVIRIPRLKLLSETIHTAFTAKNLYEINLENIQVAIGSKTYLSLDLALEKDKRIYDYLLLNLEQYLHAIARTSNTVSSDEYFIRVMNDVLASNTPDSLSAVVAQAQSRCIVENLNDVQTDAWQTLAEYNRFTATFNNIINYIRTVGSIDKHIEKVLMPKRIITEHESAAEDEKKTLAIMILNANENSLIAKHRIQLVESLKLTDHCFPISHLPAEKGVLFSLLLKSNLIEDDADTYEHLLKTDWSTRENYIEASTKFKEYITPALLHGDLKAFLTSSKILLEKKKFVIERADEFIESCDKNGLIALAQFAIKKDQTLPVATIKEMASNGIEDENILKLLRPHLELITLPQLTDILNLMGEDYPKLAVADGKTATLPNNDENKKLLEALKKHETVSSFSSTSDTSLKVNKKGKALKND